MASVSILDNICENGMPGKYESLNISLETEEYCVDVILASAEKCSNLNQLIPLSYYHSLLLIPRHHKIA